ncbi:hypothetical protein UY3_04909 [Chelonia mydas]|uniref:Uncharacterized protein n=1 Tax=Chelonia mydas TaxID=8469 RepID=M7BKW7_CHEMY|nr:hypothetical protein UY3_04909 [Chelonia mydas]
MQWLTKQQEELQKTLQAFQQSNQAERQALLAWQAEQQKTLQEFIQEQASVEQQLLHRLEVTGIGLVYTGVGDRPKIHNFNYENSDPIRGRAGVWFQLLPSPVRHEARAGRQGACPGPSARRCHPRAALEGLDLKLNWRKYLRMYCRKQPSTGEHNNRLSDLSLIPTEKYTHSHRVKSWMLLRAPVNRMTAGLTEIPLKLMERLLFILMGLGSGPITVLAILQHRTVTGDKEENVRQQYVQNLAKRCQHEDNCEEDMDTHVPESTGCGNWDIMAAVGLVDIVERQFWARQTSIDWWDRIVLQFYNQIYRPFPRYSHLEQWFSTFPDYLSTFQASICLTYTQVSPH